MTIDSTVTVVASNPRPTDTGAEGKHGAGVDVDVRVTLPDGQVVEGEVTLLPAEDGTAWYEAWGSADNWVSGDLLTALYGVYDADPAGRADALGIIERAASRVAGSPS
jgi:hypothetical protein